MADVIERFLKYISYDTQSERDSATYPSTLKQKEFAKVLVEELHGIGVGNAYMDEFGYVMASVPANTDTSGIALGLIAHMDTSPDASGVNIRPKIVKNYDGADILLNGELGIIMRIEDFPDLSDYVGQDLIVTDGTTLLGADNKSGVAEIIAAVEQVISDPSIPHGKLCIAFTPDEEVGAGAKYFDVARFGADLAYTVDGGKLGEFSYENFNSATSKVEITGVGIHPGYAKDRMVNACVLGAELQSLLPAFDAPRYSDGHRGYFHLIRFEGDVHNAKLTYNTRDYSLDTLHFRMAMLDQAAQYINEKYGREFVKISHTEHYHNMKDIVLRHPEMLEFVQKAMRSTGIEPLELPVRGGTDGAALSFKGLPCPNLCAGCRQTHGIYEFVSINDMYRITDFLVELIKEYSGCA